MADLDQLINDGGSFTTAVKGKVRRGSRGGVARAISKAAT